ncbi:MAG: hypothetical protein ABIK92_03515 [Pseudomonadota bacterium]
MENIASIQSSIRDNHRRGNVGQFFIDNISPEADLPIVSGVNEEINSLRPYFPVYICIPTIKRSDSKKL